MFQSSNYFLQIICKCRSSLVAGGYIGVYFALYATGNGQQCAAPANFDWFEYKAL